MTRAGPGVRAGTRYLPGTGHLAGIGYLAGIVEGPTFLLSQSPSGRAARKKPAMCSLASAVSSHGWGGHSRQATMPLYRSSAARG